jgi:exodeoxyribonuclease VII large subunit
VLSAVGHTGDVHLSDYVADHACETPSNAAQYFGEIGDRFLQRVQRAQTRIEHSARAIVTARGQAFDYANTRLAHVVRDVLRERERNLHALERRLVAQTPQRQLLQRAQRISALRSRLEAASRYFAGPREQHIARVYEGLERLQNSVLRAKKDRLAHWDTRLDGLDPRKLLARGYAIVTFNGRAVTDAASVPEGALIEAQVQHGKLHARVERKEREA